MEDTYKYFRDSKINFLHQYELINLFEKFDLLYSEYEDKLNSPNVLISEQHRLAIKIRKIEYKINKIIFNKKATKRNIGKLFLKSIKIYKESFIADDKLKKYLGEEKEVSEYETILKKDLVDNFHFYLMFFSNLNIPDWVKNKLNIINLKILLKVDNKVKINTQIEEFDNLSNVLYGYLVKGENINLYRNSLLKKLGIEIIYGNLSQIVREIEKNYNELSEEDKIRIENYEAGKKEEARNFYLNLKKDLKL